MLDFFSLQSPGQGIQSENIPNEILTQASTGSFAARYEISAAMNPFYLRADFDGDGKPDIALWIKSKSSGQVGIAIWLTTRKAFSILGAGKIFKFAGSSSRDFSDLNTWQIFPRGSVERGVEAGPPPHLKANAILLGRAESAGGILFWNGSKFLWYQQGD